MECEMARKKLLKLRNASKCSSDFVVVNPAVFWLQGVDESVDDCSSLIQYPHPILLLTIASLAGIEDDVQRTCKPR